MSNFLNGWSMNNALLRKKRDVYHVKVERYRYGCFARNGPNVIGFYNFHNVFGCTYFKHSNIDLCL
jgi:hypothetical protein